MKKRVLVVEDDPVLTRVLNDNLTFEGFQVRTVSDGNLATSALREFAPDLVLLDINLPGKSGLELCASWRPSSIVTSSKRLKFRIVSLVSKERSPR